MTGELNEASDAAGAAQSRPRVDRRTMIKSAAAVGAGAVAWSAPRIETLGFAPAAAAGTPCDILSPPSDDKNSNDDGNAFCADGELFGDVPSTDPTDDCCGQSFGNQGNIETFTFDNPTTDCAQIVVRTIPLDCEAADVAPFRNPDVGQFAVVIQSTSSEDCDACFIKEAVLIDSRQRNILKSLDNGESFCLEGGVDASIACNEPLLASDARLAVVITCISGVEGCVVPPDTTTSSSSTTTTRPRGPRP